MGVLDPNTRYAMAKYNGDGVTTDYSINFEGGWINATDIIAYHTVVGDRDDIVQLGVTLLNSTPTDTGTMGTVRVSSPVPVGRVLYIVRQTQRGEPLVDFVNRSMLTEANLNIITEQAIYSVAEMEDQFEELAVQIGGAADLAVQTANEAKLLAQTAVSTADDALDRANDAYDKGVAAEAGIAAATAAANSATAAATAANTAASDATMLVSSVQGDVQAAINTADAASANANAASDAANAISGKADEALSTANTANSNATDALNTANAASATANGVDGKAQSALDTANAASAAVGNKLDKTTATAQVVSSAVTFGGEVVARNGFAAHKNRSTTAAANLITWWNLDGTTAYGGFVQYPSDTRWVENTGGCEIRLQSNGYINAVGNLNVVGNSSFQGIATDNNVHQHYVGTVGVQQIIRRVGWGNGAQRWAEVLEANGQLSFWSYNGSGGNPVQVVTMESVNNAAAGNVSRMTFRGQVRAINNYSNAGAGEAAAFVATGSFGGGIGMASVQTARERYWYLDQDSTVHYDRTLGDIVNQQTLGGFYARGGFQVISDRRTKENLRPIEYTLKDFMKIKPVVGNYKPEFGDSRDRLFLVAQNAQKVVPELVCKLPRGKFRKKQMLAVDYDQAVPLLVKMVQDLYREVETLRKETRK